MKQYIDKSVVVAEIERRIQFFIEESGNSNSDIVIALYGLKSFLDTFEVKETGVDTDFPEGDLGKKTVQVIDTNGNISEVTFDKTQKGE